MASTFTTARNLEKPARGDDVGTWDTPVNANYDVIDAGAGGQVSINAAAGNVVLTANQFRCQRIAISSTLLASITITFPTSFTGPYVIQHTATGSSAFTVTLKTTAGGFAICCKPGDPFMCWNDGSNFFYTDLGAVGSYWDYCGSSMPNWVSGCTVPPYVAADGTAVSSALYPQLVAIMGGTTTPDLRGRYRAYLNQGTGRITAGAGGVDGNTLFAGGGNQAPAIGQTHLPNVNFSVTDPGHKHQSNTGGGNTTYAGPGSQTPLVVGGTGNLTDTTTVTTGITVNSGGNGTGFPVIPPTAIGGITMIRAG